MNTNDIETIGSMSLCGGRLLRKRRNVVVPYYYSENQSSDSRSSNVWVEFELNSERTEVRDLERLRSIVLKLGCDPGTTSRSVDAEGPVSLMRPLCVCSLRALLWFAVFVAAAWAPSKATACTCVGGSDFDRRAVLADVIGIESHDGWHRVTLQVVRRFREDAPSGVIVVATPSNEARCGFTFELGARYLIQPQSAAGFHEDPPDTLRGLAVIGLCSRVLQEPSAGDVIRRIEGESEPLEAWLERQENVPSAHESDRTPATDEHEDRASPPTAESPVRPGCGHCGMMAFLWLPLWWVRFGVGWSVAYASGQGRRRQRQGSLS